MSPSTLRRYVVVAAVVVGMVSLAAPAVGVGVPVVVDLAATADASQPTADADLQLPERLELDGVDAHGTAHASPDAGTTVRRDAVEARGTYEQYYVEERLDRTGSEEERAEFLRDAVASSNRTTRALRERERVARTDYAAGRIDEDQLLRELSVVAVRAEAEEDTLSVVHDQASRLAIPNVRPRAEAFTAQLRVRQGDLRSATGASIAGERAPQSVYVATHDSGTVLAAAEGGSYDREANRDEAHVATEDWGVDSNRAWELKDELYPWFTDVYGFSSISGSMTQRHLYRASSSYEHGSLVSYLDAHSEQVAREDQTLRLGPELPTHAPINGTNESVTVSVERTYPSGPARVTVLQDGERVPNAPVQVEDEVVGSTDRDGQRWIVAPYEQPEISTTVDGSAAAVELDWSGG